MANTPITSRDSNIKPLSIKINYGKVLTYLVLIAGSILAIVPFLWMISASLMNLTEATGRAVLPRIAQWDNYIEAWTGANFKDYFFNSVIIAAISITGQVIFSTLAAYAFARVKFPAKNFLFTMMLTTLMIPEAVTWIPNFITVTWFGRVGPIPWINNWPALTIPFMLFPFSCCGNSLHRYRLNCGIQPKLMVLDT